MAEYNINDILECVKDCDDEFIKGELYNVYGKRNVNQGIEYFMRDSNNCWWWLFQSFVDEYFINHHNVHKTFDYAMKII